jgi:hypothetical protein
MRYKKVKLEFQIGPLSIWRFFDITKSGKRGFKLKKRLDIRVSRRSINILLPFKFN